MKMKLICSTLLALSVIYPLSVIAADDWLASGCKSNGIFDKDKCDKYAGWPAVGSVKDIHLLSYPKDKRMSEFTPRVIKWEKGNSRIKNGEAMKYLDGYFSQSPLAETLVRVYGIKKVKHLPLKNMEFFILKNTHSPPSMFIPSMMFSSV